MANNTPNYEIPGEMRDVAEKSVEQARKAFGGFIGAAQKAVDTLEGSSQTVQVSAQDLSRRTISFAEQNVSAAFDLAQKLVRSRDLQEVMQHQTEFARNQLAAMQTQMKEVGSGMQDKMREMGQQAQSGMRDFAQAAQERAHETGEAVKQATGTAGEAVKTAASAVSDAVRTGVDKASDAAHSATDKSPPRR